MMYLQCFRIEFDKGTIHFLHYSEVNKQTEYIRTVCSFVLLKKVSTRNAWVDFNAFGQIFLVALSPTVVGTCNEPTLLFAGSCFRCLRYRRRLSLEIYVNYYFKLCLSEYRSIMQLKSSKIFSILFQSSLFPARIFHWRQANLIVDAIVNYYYILAFFRYIWCPLPFDIPQDFGFMPCTASECSACYYICIVLSES